MSGGLRRTVWERGRGLPTHIASYKSNKAKLVVEEPLVLSHLPLPTPNPQPNYKHLCVVNQILQRRMGAPLPSPGRRYLSDPPLQMKRHRVPVPRVLDDISSSRVNGLPGHSEVIYSLELIHRRMKITMTNPSCVECQEHIFDGENAFFAPTSPRAQMRRQESLPTIVTGRDWLLSGSRDRSLRLWHLSSSETKVVKIFNGGHEGSVLTHFVIDLPSKERLTSGSKVEGSPGGSPRPKKMIATAFSGGSDGSIAIWDLENGDGPEAIIQAHSSSVLCVKGDNERLVSCSKGESNV